jgi:hypothetical protein
MQSQWLWREVRRAGAVDGAAAGEHHAERARLAGGLPSPALGLRIGGERPDHRLPVHVADELLQAALDLRLCGGHVGLGLEQRARSPAGERIRGAQVGQVGDDRPEPAVDRRLSRDSSYQSAASDAAADPYSATRSGRSGLRASRTVSALPVTHEAPRSASAWLSRKSRSARA